MGKKIKTVKTWLELKAFRNKLQKTFESRSDEKDKKFLIGIISHLDKKISGKS